MYKYICLFLIFFLSGWGCVKEALAQTPSHPTRGTALFYFSDEENAQRLQVDALFFVDQTEFNEMGIVVYIDFKTDAEDTQIEHFLTLGFDIPNPDQDPTLSIPGDQTFVEYEETLSERSVFFSETVTGWISVLSVDIVKFEARSYIFVDAAFELELSEIQDEDSGIVTQRMFTNGSFYAHPEGISDYSGNFSDPAYYDSEGDVYFFCGQESTPPPENDSDCASDEPPAEEGGGCGGDEPPDRGSDCDGDEPPDRGGDCGGDEPSDSPDCGRDSPSSGGGCEGDTPSGGTECRGDTQFKTSGLSKQRSLHHTIHGLFSTSPLICLMIAIRVLKRYLKS